MNVIATLWMLFLRFIQYTLLFILFPIGEYHVYLNYHVYL